MCGLLGSVVNFVRGHLEGMCYLGTETGRLSLKLPTGGWFVSKSQTSDAHAHTCFPWMSKSQILEILTFFSKYWPLHGIGWPCPADCCVGLEELLATATLETDVLGDGCMDVFFLEDEPTSVAWLEDQVSQLWSSIIIWVEDTWHL